MKTIKAGILALAFVFMSLAPKPSSGDPVVKSTVASSIVWKSDAINVGDIPQGTPKVIDYEFKNTGKTAVLITNVKGSCGCTATDYTKTLIQPGESGKVKATFNAAAKGAFSKTVTVTTNAEETPKVLSFKGKVI